MTQSVLEPQVIIEVTEATFQKEVLQKSGQLPVVVDFWAPWCGPCRTLGPILEGLAREYQGRFILAKINTDQNQRIAHQFGIQGIPAVKAFVNGKVVAEFVGAQPRQAVRQFLEQLMPNSTATEIAKVHGLIGSGHFGAAQQALDALLGAQPDHPGALIALATLQLETGDNESAEETLGRIPPATPEGQQATQLLAKLRLRLAAGGQNPAELRAHLQSNPDDLAAHYQLAALLAMEEHYEEALEHYMAVVRRDRSYQDDGARRAMLDIFNLLGDSPIARNYRNQLASVLFA